MIRLRNIALARKDPTKILPFMVEMVYRQHHTKFNISQSALFIIEHKGGKTVWLNIGIHKHIPYIQCSFDILSCNSLCINVRSSRSKQDQDHGTV